MSRIALIGGALGIHNIAMYTDPYKVLDLSYNKPPRLPTKGKRQKYRQPIKHKSKF